MVSYETTPTPPGRLASLPEAAKRYKVSDRTIRRYIARGDISGYRFGRRAVRVDLDELERLLLRRIPTAGDVA